VHARRPCTRTKSDSFTQVKEFLGIADIDDSAALDVEEMEIARKRALQMKQARHGVRRRAAPPAVSKSDSKATIACDRSAQTDRGTGSRIYSSA
jgi:hypothetical protein